MSAFFGILLTDAFAGVAAFATCVREATSASLAMPLPASRMNFLRCIRLSSQVPQSKASWLDGSGTKLLVPLRRDQWFSAAIQRFVRLREGAQEVPVARLWGPLPCIPKHLANLWHISIETQEINNQTVICVKREMQIRHSRLHQRIDLQPIEDRLSHAVRESLRVGGNPIVLFRIERPSCLNAESIAHRLGNLSDLIRQLMLRSLGGGGENIAKGRSLALIRPKAIWSIHRMHEYRGQIWILDARQHRRDGSPHPRLDRGNTPESHPPLEVPALAHDLAGVFCITRQRRSYDHVPRLLKLRQMVITRSVALDDQHRVYAEIRQYVALQEPAKFAPTADDEYCAWIVRHSHDVALCSWR